MPQLFNHKPPLTENLPSTSDQVKLHNFRDTYFVIEEVINAK